MPVGDAHEPMRERLIESARALKLGDGLEPGVTMGPVISGKHRERVLGYVDQGVKEGARLALDGRTLPAPSDGFFVGPTVFDDVNPEMVIGRDEIFGPVAGIHRRGSRRRRLARRCAR